MFNLLVSRCFGGFGFSNKFSALFEDRYGESLKSLCVDEDGDYGYYPLSVRTDERVIELFKEMGSKFSSASSAELELVTVSSLKDLYVVNYDGAESFYYASSESEAYDLLNKDLGL